MPDPIWVDGATPLNSANLTKLQTRDEKAAASGYASLDSGGKVPLAQLPLQIAALSLTPPGSPVDGQLWFYPITEGMGGGAWQFRYNAGSPSANKWEFVGGAPYGVGVAGSLMKTTSGRSDITGSPAYTVPRSGSYLITGGCQIQLFNDHAMNYTFFVTGTTSGDLCSAMFQPGQASPTTYAGVTLLGRNFFGTLVAGETVKGQADHGSDAGGQGNWTGVWIELRPIRVS